LSVRTDSGKLSPVADQAREEEERRKSICPSCQQRGKPCCLIVGHGVRTMHYICPSCYHEWQHAELLPDDVFVFRRPDSDEQPQ